MSSIYSLNVNNSSLSVDLSGGRIVGLVLNKIPILGTFNRIDGKKGNTHLCIPNFGEEGVKKYGLPNHGPARDAVWKLIDKNNSSLTIRYDMKKIGSYPTTLSIIQTFSLEQDLFKQEITIVNTGNETSPVNCAIHYYWYTSHGWNDVQLNGQNVSEFIKKDTAINLDTKTSVDIPALPDIQLETSVNFKKIQLWTARKEGEGMMMYDQDYVCMEPALGTDDFFGNEESMLSPKESLSMWVRLTI
ncbi:MAG: hypothetical protein UU81_C0003G0012 [Microgenomates group bacterium GW2011_GWC1_41_8]|uniref:Aldose 1-epimerase n=3 Tax=Candidatus Roizmaniibacteriota TaxID=1752723 RepID=A0A0G0X5H6_9BACT|nr:MAG: hypothetical protein UU14_C0015G0009 [Candidatus Roizmanbacteria bacterium GW2011_GWB1_40_7]KKR94713.1 MAG: hypothetical protein UU41_C0004G0013 [Candidatus Roizmanbacteria bacterium GW2011_GWA1_41_13]KKS20220.1 MAG: hypothetical protein UU78_C0066G0008 [Candidatus Roizmanbacteria bacterium GW2011_GWC2_41_7]KKS24696.1 MAG: hypothetical protein UU81_C0003G0012 [Microgenomates group bacterium GW2011_GWC1_41_8]OGK50026.1 MAG: hypothetical protein A3A55_03635 [Candidatus Roizmanbacteria bac